MFISIQEAINQGKGNVALRGWVYRERKSNKLAFIVLRDGTNIIQCVIEKDKVSSDVWSAVEKILIESSVTIEGEIREDKRAPTGYEIGVTNLQVIQVAERFPITKDQSTEFLLDMRHLWLRSRELTTVWKVKAAIFAAARDMLKSLLQSLQEAVVREAAPCSRLIILARKRFFHRAPSFIWKL